MRAIASNPNTPMDTLKTLIYWCPKDVAANPVWPLFILEDPNVSWLEFSTLSTLVHQSPADHPLWIVYNQRVKKSRERDEAVERVTRQLYEQTAMDIITARNVATYWQLTQIAEAQFWEIVRLCNGSADAISAMLHMLR